MAKYNLTKKAVEDLSDIWNYTFEYWSEAQADKYYKMLLDNFTDISNNPDLGKSYNEVTINLKGLRVNRHIIFYRKLNPDLVEIMRILHERMDLKNRISD